MPRKGFCLGWGAGDDDLFWDNRKNCAGGGEGGGGGGGGGDSVKETVEGRKNVYTVGSNIITMTW